MEAKQCVWNDLFDDSDMKILDNGYLFTGFISITLGLWLNFSILTNDLRLDRSYRNLANFTVAAFIRRMVQLFAYFPMFNFARTIFDLGRCELFGFLETFLAVFEVEWLTHVCIERYVIAKYAVNGWPLQNHHYSLFQCLCLFFASLYSFPPLLGVGRYGLDFSCSTCTFDVLLPECWRKYLVIIIFILRSIKPFGVMLMMLTWAWMLEKKLICSSETQEQKKFTKNVIMVVLGNQICWTPIALIRGCVILSQIMSSDPVLLLSAYFVKWAMLIHWMSPALTAVILFTADNKIRAQMLRLFGKSTNQSQISRNKQN